MTHVSFGGEVDIESTNKQFFANPYIKAPILFTTYVVLGYFRKHYEVMPTFIND